jgi:hypothetical protein
LARRLIGDAVKSTLSPRVYDALKTLSGRS